MVYLVQLDVLTHVISDHTGSDTCSNSSGEKSEDDGQEEDEPGPAELTDARQPPQQETDKDGSDDENQNSPCTSTSKDHQDQIDDSQGNENVQGEKMPPHSVHVIFVSNTREVVGIHSLNRCNKIWLAQGEKNKK